MSFVGNLKPKQISIIFYLNWDSIPNNGNTVVKIYLHCISTRERYQELRLGSKIVSWLNILKVKHGQVSHVADIEEELGYLPFK